MEVAKVRQVARFGDGESFDHFVQKLKRRLSVCTKVFGNDLLENGACQGVVAADHAFAVTSPGDAACMKKQKKATTQGPPFLYRGV
jgi:hypothetical protein